MKECLNECGIPNVTPKQFDYEIQKGLFLHAGVEFHSEVLIELF